LRIIARSIVRCEVQKKLDRFFRKKGVFFAGMEPNTLTPEEEALAEQFAQKHSITRDLVRVADVRGGRRPQLPPKERSKFVNRVGEGMTAVQALSEYKRFLKGERTAYNWVSWAQDVLRARNTCT
jgi:hypothetical protein